MLAAITRGVSPSLERCELTHLSREPIDLAVARRQHADYEAKLESLGVRVVSLPEVADLPDSVFVEDIAIMLDEVAILTRPGAVSRRPESALLAPVLAEYRPVQQIDAPGLLDGGDVLHIGRTLLVGLSSRTNAAGIEQLREIVTPFGYTVTPVAVAGCLHLKSAITAVGPDVLLINRDWLPGYEPQGCEVIEVDPTEPHAANALRVADTVLFQPQFPRTFERVQRLGLRVAPVDMSELAKAEGALTCCSLIFTA